MFALISLLLMVGIYGTILFVPNYTLHKIAGLSGLTLRLFFMTLLVGLVFVLPYYLSSTSVALLDGAFLINSYSTGWLVFMLLCGIAYYYLYTFGGLKTTLHFMGQFLTFGNLLGVMLIVVSRDWLFTLAAYELFNLSLYLLVGARGFHYLLLSAFTTTLLVLALGVTYLYTGYFTLFVGYSDSSYMALLAILALGVKLGIAPFHYWAPHLYTGLPLSTVYLFTTVTKFAILGLFSVWLNPQIFSLDLYQPVTVLLVVASFVMGSLGLNSAGVSLRFSSSIGRFLGYSGVVHMGFIVVVLCSGAFTDFTTLATTTFYFYLGVYAFTMVGFFTFITLLNRYGGGYNLYLLVGVSMALFSLAGLPPFLGFFAKLGVFSILIQANYYHSTMVATLGILASTLTVANYLALAKQPFLELSNGRVRSTSTTTTYSLPSYPIAILASLCMLGLVLPVTLLLYLTPCLFSYRTLYPKFDNYEGV